MGITDRFDKEMDLGIKFLAKPFSKLVGADKVDSFIDTVSFANRRAAGRLADENRAFKKATGYSFGDSEPLKTAANAVNDAGANAVESIANITTEALSKSDALKEVAASATASASKVAIDSDLINQAKKVSFSKVTNPIADLSDISVNFDEVTSPEKKNMLGRIFEGVKDVVENPGDNKGKIAMAVGTVVVGAIIHNRSKNKALKAEKQSQQEAFASTQPVVGSHTAALAERRGAQQYSGLQA